MIKFFMKMSLMLILPLLLFSLVFLLTKNDRETGARIEFSGKSFMKGLQIVHKNNGNQDWILSAERADFTGDGNNAHLTKLKLKTEQKGMMILAEKGLYNIKDRSLTVDGTVIAKNGDVSITADNVEMDSRGGKLSAQGRVTVEGSKFNLRGTGMTFDDAEQKMRILNDVQATFYR